jgi:NTE family protein
MNGVKCGIALGGGGARGLAHVGVLQVLEREGFPIDLVTGTSMGGLVGGIYGLLGNTAALLNLIEKPADNDATRWSRAPRPELYESRRFRRWLRDLFGERTFADLHWPMAFTAVDIDSGEEIAFNRGPVAPAIWATTAIPGIYAPVLINGRRMVDGGMLDPVPVSVARRMGAAITIAVDVLPEMDRRVSDLPPGYRQAMVRKIGVAADLIGKSFDIMCGRMRDLRLQADPPDLLITPDLRGISAMDYSDGARIISRGLASGEAAVPQIRALRDRALAARDPSRDGRAAAAPLPAPERQS